MTPRSSDESPPSRPRRYGRLRRWLVRPALWGLTFAVVILAAAVLVLRSEPFADWVADQAEARLTERLGREVQISSVSLSLLPLGAELEEVSVAGAAAGDAPLAVAESVLVEGELVGLGRPVVRIQRVVVRRPEFRLEFYESGESNLVRWQGRGSGTSRWAESVEIGLLEIEGGVLWIDELRLPLELSASRVAASLLGTGGLDLRGRLETQDLEVTLPGAAPYLGSLAATVELIPGEARVVRSRLGGPDLAAVASGSWSWRDGGELRLEVDARGRAELLDRLGYSEGLAAGGFHYVGKLARAGESWSHQGRLDAAELRLLDFELSGAVAELSGDRSGLTARLERASYGGGSVLGTVGWRMDADDRPVSLDLDLARVDLVELLDDLGLPVQGIAGRVNGPFSYRFPAADPKAGAGRGELQVEPPARPAGDRLTASGAVEFSIESGLLSTNAARLRTGGLELVARGSHDLRTGRGSFDYRLAASRIAELFALLPRGTEAAQPEPWLPAAGGGELQGTLQVSPEGVVTDVRATLSRVSAPGFTADSVEGTLRLTSRGADQLDLVLRRPEGELRVAGGVPFESGGSLDLTVGLDGWPLEDVAAWLPTPLPATGPVYGRVELAGPPDLPTGRIEAVVRPAIVAGMELTEAEVSLELDAEAARIVGGELRSPAGVLEVRGVLDRVGGGLEATLTSAPLSLARAPFDAWTAGVLNGTLAVNGSLGGTLEAPELGLDLEWSDLKLLGAMERFASSEHLRVAWDGSEATLEGAAFGLVELSGGGRLDGEGADLSIDVSSPHLGPLARMVAPQELPPFAGAFEGSLTVAGSWASGLSAALALERLSVRHDRLTLENLEPVVARFAGSRLAIESLFLGDSSGQSELFLFGEVAFDEERLDLRAQAAIQPEWLELAVPGADVRGGAFDAIGSIGGTFDRPSFNGLGEVRDATVLVRQLPSSLEALKGIVLLYPGRVVVDTLSARTAGGSMRATGSVELPSADRPLTYRLQATGKGLNLRYPEGWLLRTDAELLVASTPDGQQLQGTLNLDRAFYLEEVKVGIASLLQSLFERRRVEAGETDEVLAATHLNLQVRGEDALRVNNNLARLEGDIDLALRGTLADPVVFGEVRLAPGGTLIYSGNEYEVRRGLLTFANPYRIEPVIDLVAEADLRDYEVALNLSGRLERLNASFSADPPLADLEILSLLSGASVAPETSPDRDTTASTLGAQGFLYGQATSLITERVNRLFGLDKLQIDPLTETSGDLSSARVTVGKRLSRDLFATYSYDPSTTEQQILELEWAIDRSLVLVLTQNGDDTYSVDARWEKAF